MVSLNSKRLIFQFDEVEGLKREVLTIEKINQIEQYGLKKHYSDTTNEKASFSQNPSATYGSFRIRKIHKFKPTNIIEMNTIMNTQNKLIIDSQNKLKRRKSARQSSHANKKPKDSSSNLYLHKIEKISNRLSSNNPQFFANLDKQK